MSLVAFALRACAVRVIRAAIASSFVVYDSPVDLISTLTDSRQADGSYSGVIGVYAGAGRNKPDGCDYFAGDPAIDLFVQILLPSQIDLSGAGGQLTINARKAGAEFALDVATRAIWRGLAVQADAWSGLFGRMTSRVRVIDWESYLIEAATVKTPGRELRLTCDVLQEPTPGAPLTSFWTDLLAAMATDSDLAPLAAWVTAELGTPSGLSQADIDRIFLGLSQDSFGLIGLGPLGGAPEEVPLSAVTVLDQDEPAGSPDASTALVPGQLLSFESPDE